MFSEDAGAYQRSPDPSPTPRICAANSATLTQLSPKWQVLKQRQFRKAGPKRPSNGCQTVRVIALCCAGAAITQSVAREQTSEQQTAKMAGRPSDLWRGNEIWRPGSPAVRWRTGRGRMSSRVADGRARLGDVAVCVGHRWTASARVGRRGS